MPLPPTSYLTALRPSLGEFRFFFPFSMMSACLSAEFRFLVPPSPRKRVTLGEFWQHSPCHRRLYSFLSLPPPDETPSSPPPVFHAICKRGRAREELVNSTGTFHGSRIWEKSNPLTASLLSRKPSEPKPTHSTLKRTPKTPTLKVILEPASHFPNTNCF